uniref:C-SKI SMAD4-binding domain-containing protein n=1 Tax=Panagrolaimus sp. JU765 TaxID=591449 RepID=A0AC34RDC6_9BILA
MNRTAISAAVEQADTPFFKKESQSKPSPSRVREPVTFSNWTVAQFPYEGLKDSIHFLVDSLIISSEFMATCVIEQCLNLGQQTPNNSSASGDLWSSLQPMASRQLPVGLPLPSAAPSTSFAAILEEQKRGQKRHASFTWTDEDSAAAQTLYSIVNQSMTSNSAPASLMKPDPSDILLYQLSKICTPQSEKLGVNNPATPFVFEADRGSSNLKSTHLGGSLISCFVVGGEIRLCGPQVFSIVLKDISEEDLSRTIQNYSIFDQPASEEQFTLLKNNQALPNTSTGCSLITKTNAERLVGALVDPINFRRLPDEKRPKLDPILIQHDCFSGCEARLFPSLYPGPCIECVACECLMNPESFCRHSHSNQENNQFCHWGFDAVNWKNYIRLHDLAENNIEAQQRFKNFIQADSSRLFEQNTLEDDIELAVKKGSPMFNFPIPALAALQAAAASAPNSAGPSTSNGPTAGVNSLAATQNLLAMMHMQNLAANSNSSTVPMTPPNLLAQLQAISAQAVAPSNLGIQLPPTQNLTSFLTALQQQQQVQNLRNLVAAAASNTLSSGDDSDIPRKRAHTVSDPSSCRSAVLAAQNKEELPLSTISFGNLPTDQQLVSLLARLTTQDNVAKISEMINGCITHRVQPVVDENARLKKELAEMKAKLEAKDQLVSKLSIGQNHDTEMDSEERIQVDH